MENNQQNETKKYIVNGVEYNSIEEVPEQFKNLITNLDKGTTNINFPSKTFEVKQKIIVNGIEYKSLEEVPENLRNIFADKNQNGIPDIIENVGGIDIKKNFMFDIKTAKVKNEKQQNILGNPQIKFSLSGSPEVVDNKYKFLVFVIAVIIIVFFYLAR